jgi:hypothetical protein
LAFANELKARVLILGRISLGPGNNTLSVDLEPHSVSDGKGMEGVRVSFPLSPEMATLIGKKISLGDQAEFLSKYPKGGAQSSELGVLRECWLFSSVRAFLKTPECRTP